MNSVSEASSRHKHGATGALAEHTQLFKQGKICVVGIVDYDSAVG